MRKGGIQKKMYRLAYDRPDINRKVMQISKSLEEVKKMLESVGFGKTDKSRRR